MKIFNVVKYVAAPAFLAMTYCLAISNLQAETVPLLEKKCIPCSGHVPALKGNDLINLKQHLRDEWKIVNEHHLERTFLFEDFLSALDFTNQLGALAEENGHHPDIVLAYGKVVVMIWTHKSKGLTESDFILAAQIDEMVSSIL